MLLFISIAFLYGTVMPGLFFIGFLGYLTLWINERISLCYYFKAPPAYDTDITEKALSIINILPLVTLPFVFWQLGNRQIFENVLFDIKTEQDTQLSGHTIHQALSFQHGLSAPNVAPFLLWLLLLSYFLLTSCCTSESTHNCQGEEHLDSYYQSVEECARLQLIANEIYYREKYNLRTM